MSAIFPSFPPRSQALRTEMAKEQTKALEARTIAGKGDVTTTWADGTVIKECADGRVVRLANVNAH